MKLIWRLVAIAIGIGNLKMKFSFRKLFLLLILLVLDSGKFFSQDQKPDKPVVNFHTTSSPRVVSEGDCPNRISLLYGRVNLYGYFLSDNLSFFPSNSYTVNYSSTGPFILRYERALDDENGIGLSFAYHDISFIESREYTNRHVDTNGVTYIHERDETIKRISSYSIGLRYNYHAALSEKLGVYYGAHIGYTHSDISVTYTTTNESKYQSQIAKDKLFNIPLYAGSSIGVRYFIVKNFGLNLEIGWEHGSLVQFGLVSRL